MNEQSLSPPAGAPARDSGVTNRLLLFFALVYVVEGVGQVGGLIAQPLSFYLKQVHGWTPLQVTAYLAIFNFPWIIKPVYGAFSDFLPLFGYRRKTYLIAANLVAAGAFLWVTQLTVPSQLVWALQLTAYAMAISSTVCGAVLVENGQRLGESGRFVNQQWLWFNVAAMTAAILGGQLVQRLSPTAALHAAAAVVALAPLAVLFGTIFLVPEKKTRIDLPALRASFQGLAAALRTRELWIVGVFLFLYYFSPGLSTPLYYTMTDSLKFSQSYIGILGSIASAGWVVGALLYRRLFGDLSSKRLLNLSIALGTVATAAYLLLSNELSAAVLSLCSGFSAMLATVATVTLAADYCPQRSEGFSFAVMMSIINLATATADIIGSFLFEHFFDNRLAPLIIVSAAFTAFAFVLVPLLRLGDKRQGQSVGIVPASGPEPHHVVPGVVNE
ncbi:MAG: MFS transporter [Xanthobacteraceae bacterium]